MGKLNKIIKDKNQLLLMMGVLHSSKAFVSPEVLHLDLTNMCNFDCIACWCRSPLLRDKAMPAWERKLTLPLPLLKSVFDDLFEMGGLKQVKLVGGGEPFMHPDILEIVEYIKNNDKKVQIDINTNFSLVDELIAERLIALGVDSLTVSVWAGTPEVYSSVHPNQTEATFDRIKEVLIFLHQLKKKLQVNHPRITIHNVILKLNYRDISEMIQFALDTGTHDIQFVPVDPVKSKTEALLLSDNEKGELLDLLYEIRKRYDSTSFQYTAEDKRRVVLSDFDGFISRTERLNTKSGAYDEDIIEEIPCYVGWLFARIMTTGNVVPCCKGHRMPMGNINKNRFKDIWNSDTYNNFRHKGINYPKSHGYFSRMGNKAVSKTGCYNCDNLWQNIPMQNKINLLRKEHPKLFKLSKFFLKKII
ncbi:MAG: radical SAM protein [Candidatus Omnitrophica bacterium]|nr:radical SAM protein [Candidatus Omnitrophota bacterium]MCK5287436.1 radical SAM protein [Candidatus Omnitrophota bacterium]